MELTLSQIEETAACQGLSTCAVADLSPMNDCIQPLRIWQENNYFGEMGFMGRSTSKFVTPQELFPESKSAVVFMVNYTARKQVEFKKGYGRVGRFAWGKDYHLVLKNRLLKFIEAVEEKSGQKIRYRIFCDAVPLLERHFAWRAGIGLAGKNTMLIHPRQGSFFLLAEVFWDVTVSIPRTEFVQAKCQGCGRCLSDCPSGALVKDYVLDARKCVSYLTIEKKGMLDRRERGLLGEWVFGCDRCQEVCPHNSSILKKGAAADLDELNILDEIAPLLSIKSLLLIRTSADFKKRFKGTALMRSGREGLLRNGAVVAGNTNAVSLVKDLLAAAREDPSPIVRSHVIWALGKLIDKCNNRERVQIQEVVASACGDSDDRVVSEAKEVVKIF
jgi:epoxyqueuosine reductase